MRRKTCTRALSLLCGLALTAALAACSGGAPAGTQAQPQESQQQEAKQELTATVNQVDSDLGYLVLVTEDGYYKLDLNGVDVSGLEPGDDVTATYIGTLSTEDEGEELSANPPATGKT